MPSINPQTFDINECKIIWASGETMDIRPNLVEFNYFEDIFSNHLSGYVMLGDSLNLENKLSFNGNEYLVVSVSKKEHESFLGGFFDYMSGNDMKPLNKILRIYKADDRGLTKDSNEGYSINFCSEEFFISQQYKICKAYKNEKISDIVRDIALNFLKIPEKEFPEEHCFPTRGTCHVVIPNLMPLEAINWLCTRAISADSKITGATFLFYRDRFNWNFKPTLAIYGEYPRYNRRNGIYNHYYYSTKNDGVQEDTGNKLFGSDFNNILSYQVLDSYDSFDVVQDGTFANKMIGINHLTRKHGVTEFKYGEYFDQIKSDLTLYKEFQPYGLMNNFENRFKDTYDNTTDSYIKSAYSTTDLQNNPYIAKNQPEIFNNYLEQIIPYRFAQHKLISSTRLKLAVAGDPYITIGDVVELHIKSPAPVEFGGGKIDKKKDKFISGKYLVTAVRHRFNQEGEFDTTLEVCKDSFEAGVDAVDTPGLMPINNDHENYQIAKNNGEF